MTTNRGADTPTPTAQWRQPDFTEPAPPLTGEVILSAQYHQPAGSAEAQRQQLRKLRRLLVPLIVVIGLIGGFAWQAILTAIVIWLVVRHRLNQLGSPIVSTQPLHSHQRMDSTDLR